MLISLQHVPLFIIIINIIIYVLIDRVALLALFVDCFLYNIYLDIVLVIYY